MTCLLSTNWQIPRRDGFTRTTYWQLTIFQNKMLHWKMILFPGMLIKTKGCVVITPLYLQPFIFYFFYLVFIPISVSIFYWEIFFVLKKVSLNIIFFMIKSHKHWCYLRISSKIWSFFKMCYFQEIYNLFKYLQWFQLTL